MIGGSYVSLEANDKARSALDEAISLGTRELGPRDPLTIGARLERLPLYYYSGELEVMAREISELGPLVEGKRGAPTSDLQVLQNERAHLAIDQGRYLDAVAAAEQAHATARALWGERDERTATSLHVLALSQLFARRTEAALANAKEALALTKALLPEKHPR